MQVSEITINVLLPLKSVQEKLESLGYVLTEIMTGKDTYFTRFNREEIENLPYEILIKNSLIIRENHLSFKNIILLKITHKYKKLDSNGNEKKKKKLEIEINNPDNAIQAFSESGLTNWIGLSQTNYFYNSGEIEIIVGTIKGLDGCFIEIETYNSIKDLPSNEQFEKLCEIVDKFEFPHTNDYSCKKCYMLYKKLLNKKMW